MDLSEQIHIHAEAYGLGSSQVQSLVTFMERVQGADEGRVKDKWQEGALKRLSKSLQALHLERVRDATEMVDVGTGAGFPGLPLAAALSDTRVTLVEQNGTRCEFLRKTAEAMELTNVDVVQKPVQFWEEGIGRFDLVTSRGVKAAPVMIRLAEPLLKMGGTLVLWGKEGRVRHDDPEADAERVALSVGLVPSGHFVPAKGMGIFAYSKSTAAEAAEHAVRNGGDTSESAPPAKQRDKLERKIEETEQRLVAVDAAIAAVKDKRARAVGKNAEVLDADLERLDVVRDGVVERLDNMRSRGSGSADPDS